MICKCFVLAFLLAIWSVIFPFLISPYERAIKCSEVRIMHRPTILHPDVDYVFLLLIPTVTVLALFMVMTFLRKDASNRDQMRGVRGSKEISTTFLKLPFWLSSCWDIAYAPSSAVWPVLLLAIWLPISSPFASRISSSSFSNATLLAPIFSHPIVPLIGPTVGSPWPARPALQFG